MITNKIGLHAGYFAGTELEKDLFEMLRVTAEAGCQAIELMPGCFLGMTMAQKQEVRRALEYYDLELVVGAGRSPRVDLSSADPAVQAAGIKSALETLTLISVLGGHLWDGLIHACWPGRPSAVLTAREKEIICARSRENLRKILPMAEHLGITCCFEVVNRFEHYLFNTAREGVAFTQDLGDNAQLLLDTFHMNIEEDTFTDAICWAAGHKKLGHFHVGEANRKMPGTAPSHLPWDSIFSALAQCGYQGLIIMEPYILAETQTAYNVCLWRDLSGHASTKQLISQIKTGVEFLRNGD